MYILGTLISIFYFEYIFQINPASNSMYFLLQKYSYLLPTTLFTYLIALLLYSIIIISNLYVYSI